MTMLLDPSCTSSRAAGLGLATVASLCLALGGCVLTGIEPDEIDVADDETGAEGGEGDGDGDPSGDGDGDATTTSTGDGDGDPTTGDGDGDGDPSTGDGDGDPSTGDGDGDPTGDGDGDGDGACADLMPAPVYDGPNAIDLANDAGNAFEASCGGVGPDALYVYVSTVDGTVTFSLDQPSFDGVLYLAGPNCVPLQELDCDPSSVEATLTVGEAIYVIVDSTQADVGGTATLTITGP